MGCWYQGIFMRDQETEWSPRTANSEDRLTQGRRDSGARSGRLNRRHRVRVLAGAPPSKSMAYTAIKSGEVRVGTM
jgi:hypothetical protein